MSGWGRKTSNLKTFTAAASSQIQYKDRKLLLPHCSLGLRPEAHTIEQKYGASSNYLCSLGTLVRFFVQQLPDTLKMLGALHSAEVWTVFFWPHRFSVRVSPKAELRFSKYQNEVTS